MMTTDSASASAPPFPLCRWAVRRPGAAQNHHAILSRAASLFSLPTYAYLDYSDFSTNQSQKFSFVSTYK